MFYCGRCNWSGMLEHYDMVPLCPDCKSTKLRDRRDPFAPKRLKKNWKKPRKRQKKIKNMGLSYQTIQDNSRKQKKAFARMNTNTYCKD